MKRLGFSQCIVCVLAAASANADDAAKTGKPECLSRVEAKVQEAERREIEGDLTRAAQTLSGILGDLRANPCERAAPDAVWTRLGHVRQRQGRFRDAEEMYRRALELRKGAGGDVSADVASSLSDIATALVAQDQTLEAGDLLRRAVEILDPSLGPQHAHTLLVRSNLGVLLLLTGQHARAEPVLRAVLKGIERVEPRPVRMLTLCYQNLAAAHFGQHELAKAEHYTLLQLELAESSGRAADIAGALSNLLTIKVEQQKFADAELLLPRVSKLILSPETSGLDYVMFLMARAAVRRAQKRLGEAASDLREAVGVLEGMQEYRGPALAEVLEELVSVLREQKQKDAARDAERRLKALTAGTRHRAGERSGEARVVFRIGAAGLTP